MTTATLHTLPETDEIEGLMQCLFGEDALIQNVDQDMKQFTPVVYSPFFNNAGEVEYFLLCDMQFANSAGAALSRIPPAVAAESAAADTIPENIFVNVYEVINVCLSLFGNRTEEPVKLGDVQTVASHEFMDKPISWRTWSVDIPRYTKGFLMVGRPGETNE